MNYSSILFILAIACPCLIHAIASHSTRHKKPSAAPPSKAPPTLHSKQSTTASKPKQARKCKVSPETLEAMHMQADAELHTAQAIERRIKRELDDLKRAKLEKQAARAWINFHSILDKIMFIESSE